MSVNNNYPVVEIPAAATASAEAAIKFLIGELVRLGGLKSEHVDLVVCQVLHRESLGSTAIGRGVAIPHSKSEAVEEVQGIVGRTSAPITWAGALDNEPVYRVCLLVTPVCDPRASLRAIEEVSRTLRVVP